ncbi:phytanoyl-CoA dioxygenase family protein [Sphingobium estronivorans]|uniref:phytanoyl-CoA dioxygenase family protein n=1 Tax=Sphingobium estronivorans TaxID=1577690 RepID=UPI0013C31484|nr:phytanoyl-CoA dioxygenase family protein [Sphingobium estronivorans]
MNDSALELDDLTVRHRDDLIANGYSIMPDAIDSALCDELVAEFGRMKGKWRRAHVQDFHGHRTARYFDLLNAAPIFQQIPIAPKVLPVVRATIGEDCLLSSYGSVSIGPGEPAQIIHADDYTHLLPRDHPTYFVNVILALSDFTEENGATRVIPGSHLFDQYPDFEKSASYETIAAEMSTGSALFTLGSIYHGGGANRTADEVRHGMTVAYVANWARPQENFTVAVAQERAATFDPELQALMGWRPSKIPVGRIYTAPEHYSGPMADKIALKEEFQL